MQEVKIGDEYQYISEILEHSFNFIVFGINKENYDIIVDKETETPSLYKLKRAQIKQCRRINENWSKYFMEAHRRYRKY